MRLFTDQPVPIRGVDLIKSPSHLPLKGSEQVQTAEGVIHQLTLLSTFNGNAVGRHGPRILRTGIGTRRCLCQAKGTTEGLIHALRSRLGIDSGNSCTIGALGVQAWSVGEGESHDRENRVNVERETQRSLTKS